MKTEPWGGRWNRSQFSQAQPSEEKKWWCACRPFRLSRLKEGEVWYVDLLLSSDSINSDCFWTVALVNRFLLLGSRFLIMQQMYATIEEMCFLCGLY
jgi:hypothetical protein